MLLFVFAKTQKVLDRKRKMSTFCIHFKPLGVVVRLKGYLTFETHHSKDFLDLLKGVFELYVVESRIF